MNNTTLFNHRTHVAAAYVSHTFSKGNWTTREGLRYEYSRLNAEFPEAPQNNYYRNLNDLVPDLSIEYKFDWAHSLKLNYSTSIQRPAISYLNPAIEENPTSRSFGNPNLSSSRQHSINLTYWCKTHLQREPKHLVQYQPDYRSTIYRGRYLRLNLCQHPQDSQHRSQRFHAMDNRSQD